MIDNLDHQYYYIFKTLVSTTRENEKNHIILEKKSFTKKNQIDKCDITFYIYLVTIQKTHTVQSAQSRGIFQKQLFQSKNYFKVKNLRKTNLFRKMGQNMSKQFFKITKLKKFNSVRTITHNLSQKIFRCQNFKNPVEYTIKKKTIIYKKKSN